jgi:hypothetical protein
MGLTVTVASSSNLLALPFFRGVFIVLPGASTLPIPIPTLLFLKYLGLFCFSIIYLLLALDTHSPTIIILHNLLLLMMAWTMRSTPSIHMLLIEVVIRHFFLKIQRPTLLLLFGLSWIQSFPTPAKQDKTYKYNQSPVICLFLTYTIHRLCLYNH